MDRRLTDTELEPFIRKDRTRTLIAEDERRCVALKANGEQCRRYIHPESKEQKCNFHDHTLKSHIVLGAGNNQGRKKKPSFDDAVDEKVLRTIEELFGEGFESKLVGYSKNGDVVRSEAPDMGMRLQYIKEYLNRKEGRPKQKIEQTIKHSADASLISLVAAEKEQRRLMAEQKALETDIKRLEIECDIVDAEVINNIVIEE
jgi:hypothetical protein